MSSIVEISISADEFALGRALQADSQVQIELEQVVPVGTSLFPFFWARGTDVQRFETAVRDEPAVDELTRIDTLTDETLFHIRWNDEITNFVHGVEEANATIVEAHGTADDWTFHLRFPAQEEMSAFQSFCQHEEIPMQVERVYSMQERAVHNSAGVTSAQRETLVTAYEEGYFERPRGITREELADELGISPQAVGGRLRRGYANLIAGLLRPMNV
ncbi:bacterio-opsin activator domain-containing protein [Haladaptatus sp.]|uniref:bacterio-opsin activator domain-containing protein n=1 Tax=Haladaptatus sp. TaxID=1973141 RepID=UPI003C40999D